MIRQGSHRRTVVWGITLVLGTFILWTIVWHMVGDKVTTSQDYRLTADNLEVTPQPPWIRTDIRAEVLRSAGIDRGQSILDAELAKRVYDAFRLHPWVERVDRVAKRYPARIQVDLVYRRPVCVVELASGQYLVDAQGVVLPSGDFAPNEAANYPRLLGIQSSPQGEVGGPWGDPAVGGGARLAAFLAESWRPLGLDRMLPLAAQPSTSSADDGADAPSEFELVTAGRTRIFWGAAPSGKDDPTAAAKLLWLKKQVAQDGPLDGRGPREIDLRQNPYRVVPITAQRTN